jgi:hypothetical protein
MGLDYKGFTRRPRPHSVASALPPDVRRWLCPAVEIPFSLLGCALGAAFGPIIPKG